MIPGDDGRHPRAARRAHLAGAEEVLELVGAVALERDAVADRERRFVGEAFDDRDLVGTIRSRQAPLEHPGDVDLGSALLRLRVGEEVEEGIEAAVGRDDEREGRPRGCGDLGQPLDRVEDLGVELARRHAHVGRERLLPKALVGGVGPTCARNEREQDGAADADEHGEREHRPPAAAQLTRSRVPDGAHGTFDRGRTRPARTPPHRDRGGQHDPGLPGRPRALPGTVPASSDGVEADPSHEGGARRGIRTPTPLARPAGSSLELYVQRVRLDLCDAL